MSSNDLEQLIFDVAEALLVPVLILTLLALAAVIIETGAAVVELIRRRRRKFPELDTATAAAVKALQDGDHHAAESALTPYASSRRMRTAIRTLLGYAGDPAQTERAAKTLADYDYASVKKLERTRVLVRAGPALGLMGTLIPLSPALSALSNGNTAKLSENLRIAFSVTVLGLLIGAVAFAISLVRDRLYGQDLSDLDYLATTLVPEPPR